MHIDTATYNDLESLSLLYYQLLQTRPEPEKMRVVLKQILNDENYHLLVMRDSDGKAIGTIMGIVCYDLTATCAPFMLIENFVVLKEYRGQGIGRKLFAEIESIAAKCNCIQAILVSSFDRENAHKLYGKEGYSLEGGFRKFLS